MPWLARRCPRAAARPASARPSRRYGRSRTSFPNPSRVRHPPDPLARVCTLLSGQMAASDVLIVIPARMAAPRLPGKPLADIAGEPMIVHVLRQARAAAVGEVVVATDSEAVAASVERAGG